MPLGQDAQLLVETRNQTGHRGFARAWITVEYQVKRECVLLDAVLLTRFLNTHQIYKRCNPEKHDLLLVCVGATIGKCALVPETMGEFSMARSVALIKPDKEKVTSNFLINILRSEAIQNDIDQCSHAAAQAGLYTNMINDLEAFVPPIEKQIKFDSFCEQVDKSKVAVQKALDKTQLLFDNLMQQYFG